MGLKCARSSKARAKKSNEKEEGERFSYDFYKRMYECVVFRRVGTEALRHGARGQARKEFLTLQLTNSQCKDQGWM